MNFNYLLRTLEKQIKNYFVIIFSLLLQFFTDKKIKKLPHVLTATGLEISLFLFLSQTNDDRLVLLRYGDNAAVLFIASYIKHFN